MDNRKTNEEYTRIGNQLIKYEPVLDYINQSEVTIAFLESDHKKTAQGKVTMGQCEKIANKYKWGIPCDFTITLFTPNIEGLTDDQIKVLLLHELLHVGITYAEGKEVYSIKPHDLEDFKYIIDNYGTDWSARHE